MLSAFQCLFVFTRKIDSTSTQLKVEVTTQQSVGALS